MKYAQYKGICPILMNMDIFPSRYYEINRTQATYILQKKINNASQKNLKIINFELKIHYFMFN